MNRSQSACIFAPSRCKIKFPFLAGSQNAESHMARRPEVQKNIMTEQELAELQRRLSLLSPFHVQEEYRVQIERCKLQSDFPPPYVIQRLVTIWKVLWKPMERSFHHTCCQNLSRKKLKRRTFRGYTFVHGKQSRQGRRFRRFQ